MEARKRTAIAISGLFISGAAALVLGSAVEAGATVVTAAPQHLLAGGGGGGGGGGAAGGGGGGQQQQQQQGGAAPVTVAGLAPQQQSPSTAVRAGLQGRDGRPGFRSRLR